MQFMDIDNYYPECEGEKQCMLFFFIEINGYFVWHKVKLFLEFYPYLSTKCGCKGESKNTIFDDRQYLCLPTWKGTPSFRM